MIECWGFARPNPDLITKVNTVINDSENVSCSGDIMGA